MSAACGTVSRSAFKHYRILHQHLFFNRDLEDLVQNGNIEHKAGAAARFLPLLNGFQPRSQQTFLRRCPDRLNRVASAWHFKPRLRAIANSADGEHHRNFHKYANNGCECRTRSRPK